MEISQNEIASGAVVVTVTGKVLLGPDSERITTLVGDLLRDGKRTIIFDIGGVKAIDSTGIGGFIASYNKIAAVGGDMRIAGAVGFLFQAFHVCRLDTVFRFYPT